MPTPTPAPQDDPSVFGVKYSVKSPGPAVQGSGADANLTSYWYTQLFDVAGGSSIYFAPIGSGCTYLVGKFSLQVRAGQEGGRLTQRVCFGKGGLARQQAVTRRQVALDPWLLRGTRATRPPCGAPEAAHGCQALVSAPAPRLVQTDLSCPQMVQRQPRPSGGLAACEEPRPSLSAPHPPQAAESAWAFAKYSKPLGDTINLLCSGDARVIRTYAASTISSGCSSGRQGSAVTLTPSKNAAGACSRAGFGPTP